MAVTPTVAVLMALGLMPPPWVEHERIPQEGAIQVFNDSQEHPVKNPRRPSELEYYRATEVNAGVRTKHRKVGRRP